MSDDRFKQARRSLIDRNKQRRQQGGNDMADDDFNEDEKTLMVSIDSVPGRAASPPVHPPGGPASDDFADAATQMVDITEFESQINRVDESTQPHREALSLGGAQPAGANQQTFSPGQPASSGAEFTPDSAAAGHEGHTEFIHIDAITAGGAAAAAQPSGNIADDPVLRQGYQFTPQSIQQGEVTLIFAQNPLGRSVVLRQIWSGDAQSMPAEWRQRLSQLEDLKLPRLVSLNGVIASQTGVWAEMSKPEGYRLSAVLGQHGPQDPENVVTWLKQAAEVIESIHAAGLIYANLTPDAIWIQQDNSIVLEPFDLLSFEKRGDLAEFGAPELKRPPQDRQLSAATDVFSLAAVGAASLTGLPLNPANLGALEDQKMAKKIQRAMTANPAERPQSVGEFADQFKSGGSSLGKMSLDPSQLDIKVVAAIAVLLLGGFAGYMYWNQQQARKAAAQRAIAEMAKKAPGSQNAAAAPGAPNAPAAAGTQAAGTKTPSAEAAGATAKAAAPGALSPDPRLTVLSSYQTNPPADGDATPLSPEEIAAKSAALLEEARKHLEKGDELASDSDQKAEYTAALESLTSAIRLRDGAPTEEERKLLEELRDKDVVSAYEKDLRERINEAIANNQVGNARRAYKQLATIDYHARSVEFFNHNPNALVRTVVSDTTDKAEDDEKKEDE
jgi:hypothetical protein